MNNDDDVKYIPPTGAGLVNSMLCVANTTTPLCDIVNTLRLFAFLIKNIFCAELEIATAPLIFTEPEMLIDPDIIGANSII